VIPIGGDPAPTRFAEGGLAAGAGVGIKFLVSGDSTLRIELDEANSLAVLVIVLRVRRSRDAFRGGGWGKICGGGGTGREREKTGLVDGLIETEAVDLSPEGPAGFSLGDANAIAILASALIAGQPVG
jgi:hypothetical protein